MHLALDADEIPVHELGKDPLPPVLRNAHRLEQGRVQRGVAEPDRVAVESRGVQ
jgi:hypothetical protein